MAADASMDEAQPAAEGGVPVMYGGEAAADLADLPSSSNGGAPHLQQAVKTKHRRTALPEHASMVVELQVRCGCRSVTGGPFFAGCAGSTRWCGCTPLCKARPDTRWK